MRRSWLVLTTALTMAVGVLSACGVADPSPDPNDESGEGAQLQRAEGVARAVPAADAPVEPTVAGMTSFGYDLVRAMDKANGAEGGNVVVSPLSIAYAFGMVEAGARGETKSQIDGTFGFPSEGPHSAFNALTRDVVTTEGAPPKASASRKADEKAPKPVVAIANALFMDQNFDAKEAFLRTLAAEYGAGVRTLDFASDGATAQINDWVKDQTADRIQKLVDSLDPAVRMVLANAVYLKAEWESKFEESTTKDETFHAAGGDVEVPMMSQESTFGYVAGDGYQAVELPYTQGDLAMWVLVPTGESTSPTSLLRPDVLSGLGTAAEYRPVRMSMPRWDFASDVDLKGALTDLGMEVPFEQSRADFTGIASDMYIAQAVHRANITVDENGTEAAAVTGIGMGVTSEPPPQQTVDVRADQPFAFAVVDRDTAAPLFVGQVADPTT